MAKKKQIPIKVDKAEAQLKDFFDLIAPSAVRFMADHFIFGDTYRCVWAVREYPPATSDQAILSRFGDKENVTLHIYSRYVDAGEQRKIIQNAPKRNKMVSPSVNQTIYENFGVIQFFFNLEEYNICHKVNANGLHF